jgi:Domain of unknown function (DUF4145)
MKDIETHCKEYHVNIISGYSCKTCKNGVLQSKISKDDELIITTNESKMMYDTFGIEIDDLKQIFSTTLICSNRNCEDKVLCSGNTYSSECSWYDKDGIIETGILRYYKPLFFYPNLSFFDLPPNTPVSIKEICNMSFSQFYINKSAALGTLRIALERLMDELNAKKTKMNKDRKRKKIKLHDRIVNLGKKHEKIKDLCLAIKWKGNAGSHGNVSAQDVLDAYTIFEEVLKKIYDESSMQIDKIAKSINKKKK